MRFDNKKSHRDGERQDTEKKNRKKFNVGEKHRAK